MAEAESPLSGGRTTAGVTRVGDTVRRPPANNAGFVRSLLRHLPVAGFHGASRYLGADERGREILSFLPGDVPADLGHYDDTTLAAAASLIRAYHDATAPLFATAAARVAGIEVACHNDLSPCNAVFRGGRPVALIDFDACAPGSRAFDLGYAAWLWLDLGNADYDGAEQRRRLQVFLTAYGEEHIAERRVVAAIIERQGMLAAGAGRPGAEPVSAWATSCRAWTVRHLAS